MDTDDDGLNDNVEPELGFNPLLADSDSDGILDADEIIERTIADTTTGASFTAQGAATKMVDVEVKPLDDTRFEGMAGLITEPVQVLASSGDVSGTLTIPFNTTSVPSYLNDVAVVHFNEETKQFDVPANQNVDRQTGIATVTTDDFSPFFLVNLEDLEYTLSQTYQAPGVHSDYQRADFVLAFDSDTALSQWRTADFHTRFNSFVDSIPNDAQFSIIGFQGELVQNTTSDRTLIKNTVAQLTDPEPTTSVQCDPDADPSEHAMGGSWCLSREAFDQSRLTPYELSYPVIIGRVRTVIFFSDNTASTGPYFTRFPAAHAYHNYIETFSLSLGSGITTNAYAQLDRDNYLSGGNFSAPTLNDQDSAWEDLLFAVQKNYILEDTDNDGVSDESESYGLRTIYATTVYTTPGEVDSDGDGLSDSEELGQLSSTGTHRNGNAFASISDPSKFDTDGDGLGDGQEVDLGTNPKLADSDSDGLNDLQEIEAGFDPTEFNADGDFYHDDEEYSNGSDPYIYDFDTAGSIHAAVSGAVFGDDWESAFADFAGVTPEVASNTWYLVGHISSGFLVVGDIRDLFTGIGNGNASGVLLSAIGLLPILGDVGRSASIAAKFGARSPSAAMGMMYVVNKLPTDKRAWLQTTVAAAPGVRLTQDIKASGAVPHIVPNFNIRTGEWTKGPRKISRDPAQADILEGLLDDLIARQDSIGDVADVRVNQQQLNVDRERVGINRPDLQYTLNGKRYYVEIDKPLCSDPTKSHRSLPHAQRIINNDPHIDPTTQVILILAGACE